MSQYSEYRILFLDLDGTIRRTKSGKTFINDPYDQEAIEGAREACKSYRERDYHLIGITNQGGVLAGFKSLTDCMIEQGETLKIFPELESILFCPDDGTTCIQMRRTENGEIHSNDITGQYGLKGTYRKPNSGMLKYCLEAHYIYPDEYVKCLMVGDREEDKEAALNIGVPFQWAESWRELHRN